MSFTILITLLSVLTGTAVSEGLSIIPTAPFEEKTACQPFALENGLNIIVDKVFQHAVDETEHTLIPPTLFEFATLFQEDLESVLGFKNAAGQPSSEGYTLDVSSDFITIAGASPLGVWWGTRSVLQRAVKEHSRLPCGTGTGTPGWKSRGLMMKPSEPFTRVSGYGLTIPNFKASLPFEMSHIRERSLTWFKDSVLDGALLSFQRLRHPPMLSLLRWKPELGLENDPTMLNLTHPESIPTMQRLRKEFLPWFYTKTVHIGADEYDKDKVVDYTRFVNELASYIKKKSRKSSRIWGTFIPNGWANVSTDVAIQHWAYYEGDPWSDYLSNNYEVIKSDMAIYAVPKWSAYFRQSLDRQLFFTGNTSGGPSAPNILDPRNATINPLRNTPGIQGYIAPLWNDFGPTGSTQLDAYRTWRDGLPALADKQWGGDVQQSEYKQLFEALQPAAPGQNLDRSVPSVPETILEYDFQKAGREVVEDRSGNSYHGRNHGCETGRGSIIFDGSCHIDTPLKSYGKDYTLSLEVRPISGKPSKHTLF
uniref:Beta-hexosaminidase bacterial type N-terminal domain-containing protein n=1 Tax=Bionectria ochroleuca TaxID=29856 RepID=A0A0B7KJW5_BIOOC